MLKERYGEARIVGEGLIEEVRSELGLDKRVQLGQVERKWEDHPKQWDQHTRGTDHRVRRAPLWRNETARQ